jgi:hypothetical protein
MPSVTAPIRPDNPAPFGYRERPRSAAGPPFRLRGCWQRTIDSDGRGPLVCRWLLETA